MHPLNRVTGRTFFDDRMDMRLGLRSRSCSSRRPVRARVAGPDALGDASKTGRPLGDAPGRRPCRRLAGRGGRFSMTTDVYKSKCGCEFRLTVGERGLYWKRLVRCWTHTPHPILSTPDR